MRKSQVPSDEFMALRADAIDLRGLIQQANSDHAKERDALWSDIAELRDAINSLTPDRRKTMPYDDLDIDAVADQKAYEAQTLAQAFTEGAVAGLRSEVFAELNELRDELRALERVLNSRTEHLA